MEGDGDDVQVSVESSWNVLQGSLDSCVTVVFLDPHTHDPIISTSPRASGKLILAPPTDPGPCEITVKFQARLCHVESFYSLSTARICELYSHSKHEADPDYICTVKGWIPYEERGSSDEGNEIVSEEADVMQSIEMQEVGLSKGSMGESVMSSGGFQTDALNRAVDVDAHKSVYSSGDDSWVDLKSNGSFIADHSLMVPELDNWHVPLNEDELAHLNDQLVRGGGGLASNAKGTEASDDSGCCESKVQHIVRHDTHQVLFEAELELVDHSPWAAVTIRLLSLQDKSLVEVDEMVLLAVSGPVQEPVSPPCQSSEIRANSLLAMFVPNMLQMARGVSDNSKDLPKRENRGGESCDQAADNIVDNFAAEDSNQSCEVPQDKVPSDREEIDASFLQNEVSKEEVLVKQGIQDVATQLGNNASENSLNLSKCKKLEGDIGAKDLVVALEAFSERFDRLESLCLRMEAYFHRTFENLDQRLTHLEAQDRKGSAEAVYDSVSLKHASTSINALLMKSHHGYQESPPPSLHSDTPTDSAVISECKEAVSPPSAQSGEQGCSDERDMVKEIASPTHVVNSVATETLMKEAPLEGQEMSRAAATTVRITAVENKRPFVSLDDAWASALSAFASSFSPVREADAGNTVTDRAEEKLPNLSILMSQEYEPLKQDVNALNAYTHTVDADSEGDGPIYADHIVAHRDNQSATAHASPIDVPLNEPDIVPPSNPLNLCTSVSSDSIDLLDLKEVQSTLSKVRTVVSSVHEDTDLAPSLSQDAPSAGPTFDVCTSADSGSMVLGEVKDNLAALMGCNAGLLPEFDPTSPLKQYAHYLTVNDKETKVNSYNSSSLRDHARQSQNTLDFLECEERNLENFLNERCHASASEVWLRSPPSFIFLDCPFHEASSAEAQFRPISSSSFGAPQAPQTVENIEELLCNNRVSVLVDLPDDPVLIKQGWVRDMNEVHDTVSVNSTPSRYCEAEAASTFPDVLDEDCSNYQDGRACSDDSLCFSQDFDTCQNDLCEDEWSCAPNVFYLNDPEFTDDDEVDVAAADADEKPEMSDVSDSDSTEDLPFWPALRKVRTDQQQPTSVFPGFENLS